MSCGSALCRLITIPEWLAAPSKYQRYWVRYTLAGVASLWALRFLYMCAPRPAAKALEVHPITLPHTPSMAPSA